LKIQEEKEGKVFYSCTSCKKKIDLREGQEVLCQSCGSFRLSLLNPGIATIKKELEKMGFTCFDITSLETKASLKKICGEFYDTPGAVLIGTSKALPYIKDKVSLSAILSLDTLFYTEDPLLDDKILWLLSHIYENTKNYFFIQTKFPTKKVFTSFVDKDSHYKENLIAEKKEFSIPPFGKIITIEKKGNLSPTEKSFFEDIFGENLSLSYFNNKTLLSSIFSLDDFHKNKRLLLRIQNLPKEFTVKVF
jgi:primosomal protein N'